MRGLFRFVHTCITTSSVLAHIVHRGERLPMPLRCCQATRYATRLYLLSGSCGRQHTLIPARLPHLALQSPHRKVLQAGEVPNTRGGDHWRDIRILYLCGQTLEHNTRGEVMVVERRSLTSFSTSLAGVSRRRTSMFLRAFSGGLYQCPRCASANSPPPRRPLAHRSPARPAQHPHATHSPPDGTDHRLQDRLSD